MPTALVTGATAGLGAAFARRLAADGFALVLVARDADRLRRAASDLGERHAVTVEALAADLTDPVDRARVGDRLGDAGRPVDLLVNNAGTGLSGVFWQLEPGQLRRQHDLNVTAVLDLTRAVLPGMVARGGGAVVNVASVAALIPGRGVNYAAGKAWVIAFSRGLAGELAGTGVRVLATCPGFVRTEFHRRAAMDVSRAPGWMWLDADDVVDDAMTALARDAVVTVPSLRYRVLVAASRAVPNRIAYRVGAGLSRRRP